MDDTAKTGQPAIKGFKRKAHDLSELNLVKTRVLGPDEHLPLVMEPGMNNLDLAEWATNNRALIESKLFEHGAILFRGFNLKTVQDFERVASSICPDLFGSTATSRAKGNACTRRRPTRPISPSSSTARAPTCPSGR